MQQVLGVLEDRIGIGLGGRDERELVFSETLSRSGRTLLNPAGSLSRVFANIVNGLASRQIFSPA
jgi:hypothetical protein